MGRACLVTFIVVFSSLSVVQGQDFIAPMEISAVQAVRVDGNVTLQLQVMHYVKEEVVRIIEVDGQQREITSVVQTPLILKVELAVDGKDVRVFDLQGEIVEADKLPARLGMNAAVVMSPTGKVPARYRQILRDDTLVLSITGAAARDLAQPTPRSKP